MTIVTALLTIRPYIISHLASIIIYHYYYIHYSARSISPDHRSKSKNLIMIATLSGSGFLLLVLSSILIVACVCGWSIYRRRKQRKMKGEDEYSLLDNEYTEM